ncbi:MAG TPA: CBS domain-containing protein [Methanoregulaceae archaeon]|nr:CBS domain-containing protein [Methanoregulaceae archaeon]
MNSEKTKKTAEAIKDIVVEDIMSVDFEYISPQEPIDAIIKEFSSGRCSDLIVADTDGRFLGVITPIDLISHVNPSMGVRSRKKAPCIECILRGDASVAEDIMARSHITISVDTPIVEALRLLEKYRHPDLVVTDKDGITIGVLGICSIISHLRVVGHL